MLHGQAQNRQLVCFLIHVVVIDIMKEVVITFNKLTLDIVMQAGIILLSSEM